MVSSTSRTHKFIMQSCFQYTVQSLINSDMISKCHLLGLGSCVNLSFLSVCLCLQFAPVGVIWPSDVLQQHPHSSTGLQPACIAFPHRLTPHTPYTHRTHTPGFPSPVPRSAVPFRDAVPLQTHPLKEIEICVQRCVYVRECVYVCGSWVIGIVCECLWT